MLLLRRGLSCKTEEKKRADERTRTADLLITSELLYLLSYVGLFRAMSISHGFGAFMLSGLIGVADGGTL